MIIKDIRKSFLSFFEDNDHKIIRSAPIVPESDPSLLFTAAGMVPFKNYFLQTMEPPHHSLVSAQKCVRAGGKHNDFENVGYTKRHNTFFEMLGNFSFGKYFKEEAIDYAWSFLTKELGLKAEKLSVTYFHTDLETKKLWGRYLPESKIQSIDTDDNFWSMGDTGPCGPCTEIFYDFSDMIQDKNASEEDRIVEIWNLVFMQYNAVSATEKVPLDIPCVDTGVGLERLACILQGVTDNYETDILKGLKLGMSEEFSCPITKDNNTAFNVLADHLRCASFLVGDGVFPENTGRGYVLRKILRRAMRYMRTLDVKSKGLHSCVPILSNLIGDVYAEVSQHEKLIMQTIQQEEEKFSEILHQGLKVFSEEKSRMTGKAFSEKVCFELYDTYGFPLELSYELILGASLTIDRKKVEMLLEDQKERSKASNKLQGPEGTSFLLKGVAETNFVGYVCSKAEGRVLAVFDEKGQTVQCVRKGEVGFVVTDTTPFYAESGGQVGDTGEAFGDGIQIAIEDTQKKEGVFFHKVQVKEGEVLVGTALNLSIDVDRRSRIQANHTATHLLHGALRSVFSDSVVQKGSLVNEKGLRFDFRLVGSVSDDDLKKVEEIVNANILENALVETKECSIDQAKSLGAIALFGEKYADTVRVVCVGEDVSKEFCGGCHVPQTGSIGFFKVVNVQSVGADTKRIQALTGMNALRHTQDMLLVLTKIKQRLSAKEENLLEILEEKLSKTQKDEEGVVFEKEEKIALGANTLLVRSYKGGDFAKVRKDADGVKGLKNTVALFWMNAFDKKVTLGLAVSPDLEKTFSAKVQIKPLGEILSGKSHGGGRDDFAQCGGGRVSTLKEITEFVVNLLQK